MIPQKILLTYYPVTRARLELARIPLGMTITKWINAAIQEKLDREQPETIGVTASPVVEAPPAVVPVKQLESVPPVAQDSDFWGEDEADKVRALVKRHTR
jgi:hypothetical protein